MKFKKNHFKLFLVFIILLICIPIVTADMGNSTRVITPFITIDPIGNHTVNDVIFINGTTNLGKWENTLDLDIEWEAFNPAGRWSSMYITNVSILPGENGTGTWSATILPSQWEMFTDVEHRTTVFRAADPGEYVVYAESTSPLGPSVITQQTFFLVPVENNRTPEPMNMTVAVPGKSENAPVPTRQNAPVPWYLPVIAAGAVTIWYSSKNQKQRKE